ncbi:AraC family transcriptional regulator [Actinoplanes sp. ATCC 53533]|uniref:helix-turn-helix transcriptional regulator n=1 Tax=Actinoplanes sp. ATCC 53533 TaxID=1288362 RepID=UPI000F7A274C|nr:helix-turn-helix transcriptional regulator [Actinoplanes sp. ATCC 53533]RSM47509.1 AraC family transcriptional regulator [Actinoplanes sp. ATCC 53533]
MQQHLGEPMTVDDMARAALFSKFHFMRMFQRSTGVSPGRFLSALRIQRAKHLLVSTSLRVAEISWTVGYTSVGTFSTRFTRSVGLSPSRYRRLGSDVAELPIDRDPASASRATGTLRGRVLHDAGATAEPIFVGVFRERIPEGRPVQYRILDRPGNFVLDSVPVGAWHLLGHAAAARPRFDRVAGTPLRGCRGPIVVRPGAVAKTDLRLAPKRALDPPVLLAQLDATPARCASAPVRL